MYLNRANIELINRLKALWGPERFSQTNSRKDGHFLKHIRLYDTAEDKKLRRRFITITDEDGIKTAIKAEIGKIVKTEIEMHEAVALFNECPIDLYDHIEDHAGFPVKIGDRIYVDWQSVTMGLFPQAYTAGII